jgi:hypothetical protein
MIKCPYCESKKFKILDLSKNSYKCKECDTKYGIEISSCKNHKFEEKKEQPWNGCVCEWFEFCTKCGYKRYLPRENHYFKCKYCNCNFLQRKPPKKCECRASKGDKNFYIKINEPFIKESKDPLGQFFDYIERQHG